MDEVLIKEPLTLTFLEKRTLESKEENLNTDTLNHYFYLMAKQYPNKFGLFRTNLFSFLRNEIPMNTSPVPESGNFSKFFLWLFIIIMSQLIHHLK